MSSAHGRAGKAIWVALALVAAAALAWWSWRKFAAPAPIDASRTGPNVDIALRGKPLRSAPEAKPAPAGGSTVVAAPPAANATANEWTALDVADLSNFDYEDGGQDIPPEIQAWNGKQVQIHGYMNPTRFTKEGVAEFMLTAFPGACCFGSIPRLNEWVVVRMPEGQSTEYAYYAPIAVQGVLEVGEEVVDDVVQSLFRMQALMVAIED